VLAIGVLAGGPFSKKSKKHGAAHPHAHPSIDCGDAQCNQRDLLVRRCGQVFKRASQVKIWLALIVLWTAASSHGFAVSDGDTVKFGKQLVRLFGIDAPEKGQPCDDGHWYPGPLATKALVKFIAGPPVSCHQSIMTARTTVPSRFALLARDDLQALMVSAGWAWAYTAFSDQYADAERGAAARGVGVHAHRCQPPWEWRSQTMAAR
jgi:endonuclease YncB( thermonuclease family)